MAIFLEHSVNENFFLQFYNHSIDQYESDLVMVVKSLFLSISETYQVEKAEACDASCILYSLVKLLQSSGYDAALCATKWQNDGKVPGGMLSYIYFSVFINVFAFKYVESV